MVGDEMCCRILCYRDKLTADRGSCLRHGGPRWARSGLTCSGRLMRSAKYRQNARVGQIGAAWFYSARKHEAWSCFLVFVSLSSMTEQFRNDVRHMRRCDCGMWNANTHTLYSAWRICHDEANPAEACGCTSTLTVFVVVRSSRARLSV